MKADSSSHFGYFRPAFRFNLFLCPKRTKKKDFHFNQVQLVSTSLFGTCPDTSGFANAYFTCGYKACVLVRGLGEMTEIGRKVSEIGRKVSEIGRKVTEIGRKVTERRGRQG